MNKKKQYSFLTPIFFLLLLVFVTGYVMVSTEVSDPLAPYFLYMDDAWEYFWRLFWASLLVLIVLYSIVMCWHAIRVIINNREGIGSIKILMISLVMLLVIVLVVWSLVDSDSTFGAVAYFLKDDANIYMYKNVKFLFAISSSTVLIVTFSLCFIIYENNQLDVAVIKRKNQEFKRSFYITAGYLGIGVIHFYSLFTWASYSMGEIETHKTLIYAVTIASSLLYTLVFVVMFVPVSIRVRSWVERFAEEEDIEISDLDEFDKFRKEHDLYDSPRNKIKQLVVLFSPVLVGILSSAVGQLVS